MASCPVCGVEVDKEKPKFKVEKHGKTEYFDSEICTVKFVVDHHKYDK